jgi:protein TonB
MMKFSALKLSLCISLATHAVVLSSFSLLNNGQGSVMTAIAHEEGIILQVSQDEPQAVAAGTEAQAVPTNLEAPKPELAPVEPAAPVSASETSASAPEQPEVVPATPIAELDLLKEVPPPVCGISVCAFSARPSAETASHSGSFGECKGRNASYLFNPKPGYPKEARARKQQGQVIIALQVTAQGLPEQVEVSETSGFDSLDQAAIGAVKNWHFIPAESGHLPIASRVEVPINFKLAD